MKPKNLLPLVVVLAVLVALVVFKQTTKKTQSISEQVGLVTLLPEGLSKSDLGKLELYAGGLPNDKLTLAYDAPADKWRVASHFNAPVKKDVIDKYLDAIVKLQGEPRATGASEADLEQYDLTDAKAFHVIGYKKDAAEPLFHILVGKAPGYQSVFVRKADGSDVFVEDTNLRQQAGIYGGGPSAPGAPAAQKEEAQQKPEAATWLDKEILKLDTTKITKAALTFPDKSMVFERREKPKEPQAEAAPGASGESEAPQGPADDDDAAAAAPSITAAPVPALPAAPGAAGALGAGAQGAGAPQPPQYEWQLTSGGPGAPIKQDKVAALIAKFASFTANDVVDPAKKAEWGLDNPTYVCVLSIEGQPDVRIEAARPNPAGDAYVRVVGAKEDLVYTLNKYTFETIFPKGGDFFDLPSLALDKKTIDSIQITEPEGKVVLAKSEEKWAVHSPAADLKPQSSTLDTIASTISMWKPADYADAGLTLGEPARVVTVSGGGQSHTIQVYADAKHIDGAYARLDDGNTLLVMSRADVGKIFVAPKDLFERKLFDLDDTAVSQLEAVGAFTVARKDADWQLTAGGATAEANKEECDKLAREIADLQASDVLFGKKEIEGAPAGTLRVKMSDNTEHVLTFGPEKDGSHELKVSGKNEVFLVPQTTKASLFPAVETLKKQEAPAPAPTPEAASPAPAPAPSATPAEAPAPPVATVDVSATPPPAQPTPAPTPMPGSEQKVLVSPASAAPAAGSEPKKAEPEKAESK